MAWKEDGSWEVALCHDCGCSEGELHESGCDMERCPFCGGQLISCDCCYDILGIDCSPGTWAYHNGLTKEQDAVWDAALKKRGLIPYIRFPIICGYCGKRWPELFMVPDAEWNKYIRGHAGKLVICRDCYDKIKGLIDTAEEARNAENQ